MAPVGKRATARKKRGAKLPTPWKLPPREWDRATELVRLFIATGRLANARPQSMLLIADPGSGKSELLDRFKQNISLEYASDLTVQGLYPIIRRASEGQTTGIVATEFQKFFLRKSSTAQNTLGTLCQFIEEGVGVVRVGKETVDFGGAQGNLIGAMTSKTAAKWDKTLAEYGFWSRVAAFSWEMSRAELEHVMRQIANGNTDDLRPVIVPLPRERVTVGMPPQLARQLMEYTRTRIRAMTPLRVFNRFRALCMASAMLDDRTQVHARDVEKVFSFHPYWQRMKQDA